MTCRGYDVKAVKISKEIKRVASNILDNQVRRSFIRGYVQVAEQEARTRSRGNKKGD